jgi:hypothetical protein
MRWKYCKSVAATYLSDYVMIWGSDCSNGVEADLVVYNALWTLSWYKRFRGIAASIFSLEMEVLWYRKIWYLPTRRYKP